MKDKEKEIKFNNNSTLTIFEDDGKETVVNMFGQVIERNKLKSYVATGEVNFGSFAKPNTRIVRFRYNIPTRK